MVQDQIWKQQQVSGALNTILHQILESKGRETNPTARETNFSKNSKLDTTWSQNKWDWWSVSLNAQEERRTGEVRITKCSKKKMYPDSGNYPKLAN